MTTIIQIVGAFYYIFPAYCANGAPVLLGGGSPIDGGRKAMDGNRIFGSHKTWRGFIFGLIIGTFVGWVQENYVTHALAIYAPDISLPEGSFILGFALSIGAMFGDLLGSFIKRRLNLNPGASLPLSDQIDFVLIALAMGSFVKPLPLISCLIIIIFTGPIHLFINILAYLLNLKENPW